MKSFTACEPGTHKGKTDVYLTPISLIDKLGRFDLDPCAFYGHNTAISHYYENGLEFEWFNRIWLNPPYSNLIPWIKKLESHGNGIALTFARTDTKWFHDLKFDAINFIKGRIKFGNSNFEFLNTANCPSMLIAFGKQNISSLFNVSGKVIVNL